MTTSPYCLVLYVKTLNNYYTYLSTYYLFVLIAVELMYGTIYCFKCHDYVYDCSVDEISRNIERQLAHSRFLTSRQPVAYVAWEPTQDEMELLKQNPRRKKLEPGSTLGDYFDVF